jgi:DNA-binding MarR family transcriptional regulator
MAKSGKKTGVAKAEALAESPSHLLHRVLQRAVGIYAEEMGSETLTQRQFAVLTAAAGMENPSQTDLVAVTGIDRSTLAELVARMIDKGLLQRERSADDGRAKTVRLTEAGQAALGQARPCVKAADKRILSLLPKPKRDGFIKLLARLAEEPEKPRKDKAPKAAKAAPEPDGEG